MNMSIGTLQSRLDDPNARGSGLLVVTRVQRTGGEL